MRKVRCLSFGVRAPLWLPRCFLPQPISAPARRARRQRLRAAHKPWRMSFTRPNRNTDSAAGKTSATAWALLCDAACGLCARAPKSVAAKNSAATTTVRARQTIGIELSSYAEFKARQQDHDHTRCVVQIHLEIFSRGCQSIQANIRDLLVRSFSNLNVRTSPSLHMHAGLLDDARVLACLLYTSPS